MQSSHISFVLDALDFLRLGFCTNPAPFLIEFQPPGSLAPNALFPTLGCPPPLPIPYFPARCCSCTLFLTLICTLGCLLWCLASMPSNSQTVLMPSNAGLVLENVLVLRTPPGHFMQEAEEYHPLKRVSGNFMGLFVGMGQ